ncbi:MAG: T9SS C-terminal target domain-containing protein [Haliscomenobacteraceae bacterium CHB4]|nr:T9SS C-terminal target domain-containing protein [Haliscomenobacteraceae bacterium CHB4]
MSVALSANLHSPVFRLYDMTGRLVREERLAFGLNDIETGGLAAGMYFWSVEARGEVVKSGKIYR